VIGHDGCSKAAMNRPLLLTFAMLALAASFACQAQPRQRPLDVGPVASGPGTIEFERRRLLGTWQLERFEVIDSAGSPTLVKAQAVLSYDEYGNLSVRGKLLEPLPGATAIEHPLLEYNGPIVLDPPKQQFRLGHVKMTGGIDPTLESRIDPSFVRKYELSETTLKISYMNTSGNPTAVASFGRR
jgi:hypothetical protein